MDNVPSIRRLIFSKIMIIYDRLASELKELTSIQKMLLGTSFLMGIWLGGVHPFWKRFTSVLDIPTSYFGPTAPVLRGIAVSVSDGDTIRFLHVPTWFHPRNLRKKEKVSQKALAVRLCTIDTPETAKFGKKGQPFGPEAKEHLKALLNKKTVNIRMLQKDQYGRAVCQVFTGRWPLRRHVDKNMLKSGLAEVYQGGGAVYGPEGKERYLEIEDEAKQKQIGIWSLKKRESAADYKRRTK